jgi:hypothetical protein
LCRERNELVCFHVCSFVDSMGRVFAHDGSPTAIPESANIVSRPLLLNAAATDNVNSKKKSLFKPAA